MIGALLSGLFSLVLNLIATILQIVLLPVNLLFENVFPDFSTWTQAIYDGVNVITSQLGWAVSFIPPFIREILLFILTIEIALFAIMKSTRLTSKLWNLLQKVKLW